MFGNPLSQSQALLPTEAFPSLSTVHSDISALRASLRASVDASHGQSGAGMPLLPSQLQDIFRMIQALDENSKNQLLNALQVASPSPRAAAGNAAAQPPKEMPRSISPVNTSSIASPKPKAAVAGKEGKCLDIMLLSSWDGGSTVGLTEVRTCRCSFPYHH